MEYGRQVALVRCGQIAVERMPLQGDGLLLHLEHHRRSERIVARGVACEFPQLRFSRHVLRSHPVPQLPSAAYGSLVVQAVVASLVLSFPFHEIQVVEKQQRMAQVCQLPAYFVVGGCGLFRLEWKAEQRFLPFAERMVAGQQVGHDEVGDGKTDIVVIDFRPVGVDEHRLEAQAELSDRHFALPPRFAAGGYGQDGIDIAQPPRLLVLGVRLRVADAEVPGRVVDENQFVALQQELGVGGPLVVGILEQLVHKMRFVAIQVANHFVHTAEPRVLQGGGKAQLDASQLVEVTVFGLVHSRMFLSFSITASTSCVVKAPCGWSRVVKSVSPSTKPSSW